MFIRLFNVVSLGLEKEAENRHRPLNEPEKVINNAIINLFKRFMMMMTVFSTK